MQTWQQPVRDDPQRAGDVRPSQALPEQFRRRREARSKGIPVSAVSKTVSAGYSRVMPNCEGILWSSARNQAEYNQKKANVGTNPSPSAGECNELI